MISNVGIRASLVAQLVKNPNLALLTDKSFTLPVTLHLSISVSLLDKPTAVRHPQPPRQLNASASTRPSLKVLVW